MSLFLRSTIISFYWVSIWFYNQFSDNYRLTAAISILKSFCGGANKKERNWPGYLPPDADDPKAREHPDVDEACVGGESNTTSPDTSPETVRRQRKVKRVTKQRRTSSSSNDSLNADLSVASLSGPRPLRKRPYSSAQPVIMACRICELYLMEKEHEFLDHEGEPHEVRSDHGDPLCWFLHRGAQYGNKVSQLASSPLFCSSISATSCNALSDPPLNSATHQVTSDLNMPPPKGAVLPKMEISYLVVFGTLSRVMTVWGACDKPFWLYTRLNQSCRPPGRESDDVLVVIAETLEVGCDVTATTKTSSLSPAWGQRNWFNRLYIQNGLSHAPRTFTVRLSAPSAMRYEVFIFGRTAALSAA